DMKVSILSVDKAVEVWNKNKFGNLNVFVLFRNVKYIKECQDKGLNFEEISLGQMAIINERKQIYKQLGLDESEAQTVLDLEKSGVNIYFQMQPTDKKESLEIIKKVFPDVN
ncbi:MAG: PTS sugar transporter subunit IIB, partial [Anaerostipes faecalis]|nr:PTS sugar transporter subunit IIB [Anaerostipes faecalis]